MSFDSPYVNYTNDELISKLTALRHTGFYATPPLGYSAVREDICAIHIEANLRQQHAPRFRPMQRLAKHPATPDEENAARDRQIIDIHWRAYSKDKPNASANNYATIFDNDPFDLAAAERFAQEAWTAGVKAAQLHLTEPMQWENAVIQNKRIQKKWRVIDLGDMRGDIVKQDGAPQIEKKLREAAHRKNTRQVEKHILGMLDAWKTRQIVGDSPAEIARMIALMTGNKQRDPRAVSRTLASLDRLLGKPVKPGKKGRNSPKDSRADIKRDGSADRSISATAQ